jgi:RimJ/RimL family protein N-acetyltransferase
MVHNERAIGLYEKLGFQREGRKRDVLRVSGEYVDEVLMAKLPQEPTENERGQSAPP